jgi:hypothetical protein
MKFPERMGPFIWVHIMRYDKSGYDVPVGYNLARFGSAIAPTIYVYPRVEVSERLQFIASFTSRL